jgi:hypothetical protein
MEGIIQETVVGLEGSITISHETFTVLITFTSAGRSKRIEVNSLAPLLWIHKLHEALKGKANQLVYGQIQIDIVGSDKKVYIQMYEAGKSFLLYGTYVFSKEQVLEIVTHFEDLADRFRR